MQSVINEDRESRRAHREAKLRVKRNAKRIVSLAQRFGVRGEHVIAALETTGLWDVFTRGLDFDSTEMAVLSEASKRLFAVEFEARVQATKRRRGTKC